MADRARMFVPGYNPGPVAAGLASDSSIMALVAKRLKMKGIPTGDNVSAHFPWMRYVRETVEAGVQLAVKRAQWDDTFYNNTPRPILVTEVRIYLGNKEPTRDVSSRTLDGTVNGVKLYTPPVGVPLLQKSLWVKMSIPDRKDILQKWAPYPLINTVDDFNVPTEVDRMAFPLPAPYFLNRSNPFIIDIPKNEALLGGQTDGGETAFFLHLHGWGKDGQPFDLVKRVPTIASTEYDPFQYMTVVFNEDRDMPMRDGWITHIGIGAGVINNRAVTDSLGWVLQNLQLRPHAPEGPSWHSGEFFPVALLAEQIASVWTTATAIHRINAGARHVPVVPYILFPGESFKVELWNRTDVYAKQIVPTPPDGAAVSFSVDVGVLGIQEKL